MDSTEENKPITYTEHEKSDIRSDRLIKSDEIVNKQVNSYFQKKNHWDDNNIMTLLSWIAISTFNINCLELAIVRYRNWMRQNIILGLVLSTTSGTISVTQFGSITNQNVTFILNFLFTIFSFAVAISTGCIKVYQVQERLEKFISVKQEWIVFITKIATELQLPVNLRKNALELININKSKYLDLLKIDNEIPDFIKQKVREGYYEKKKIFYQKDFHPSLDIGSALSISDIILNIGYIEGKNLFQFEKEDKTEKKNNENYDMELNDYFRDNYRNCISRNPSFDIPFKKENKILDNLDHIIPSIPSFFHKTDGKQFGKSEDKSNE